ncbi:MAG: SDR family NAD(P)-dependent oxidoreductase [Alphaproteobacteria bacterium]
MTARGRMTGKVAIVTGAAPRGEGVGNGKAAAILFAREGAKVVLVNRSAERAQKLADEIAADGGEAAVFAGDLSETGVADRMATFATERFGGVDVLHNNLGIGGPGTAETTTLEAWNQMFQVNLTSALLCIRACLPEMRKRGGGSIINVSSIAGAAGLMRETGAVAYTTTKAGLHGLTLSVAADYAREGIRCNCIIVGTVYTPMVGHYDDAARERRRLGVPLQTEGTGWDIGWAAVYLASDESRWVTGALLPVDGGFLALRDWPR